jgi:hypothetical protein
LTIQWTLEAVEGAFGSKIDYSMLVKVYGQDSEADTHYSPAECIGCQNMNNASWEIRVPGSAKRIAQRYEGGGRFA